ncbi:MAG: carboxypeptidase regulatory-like domain-containing protein [Ruminococcus sp.]|nr:carboxypeptidase regulatory-like domain-containing protein [Ruminococcus sp.]
MMKRNLVKKLLSATLSVAMLVCLIVPNSVAALSEDTSWYNSTDTSFTITTATQLAGLASLVNNGNNFSDKTIKLGNNIDLNSEDWTPIGTYSSPFSGTFDGQGYMVNNLSVSGYNYAGLFGYANGSAVIKNVMVKGSVSGTNYVGGIVGYITSEVTVESCTNIATVSSSSGTARAGGVVGSNSSGTVSNCINASTIAVDTNSGYTGGLMGQNYGTVINCYNTGNVSNSSNNAFYTGGVVGQNNATISNCYNTGDVSGGAGTGGIVGRNLSGTVSNCYNTGAISSGNYSYGVTQVGGAVGFVYSGTIFNNYYLSDAADTATDQTATTASQFESGEVAYLLNGSVSGGTTWYQNLDNGEAVDSYPVLDSTHGTVYYGTNCAGTIIYSNSPVSAEHSYETVITAPTCTENGYTTYTCSLCGDSYTADETEALGHTTEIQNAKEATITEDGYTGDEVCTVCGEVVKYGEVIPSLSKDITGTINVSDADATTDMTVTAIAEDGTETSVTATSMGEYTIEKLAPGTYTLVASGGKYVPCEYSIEVDTEDITQDVSLNPYGDVNGDGNVTTADVGLANSHAKGVNLLEDYEFDCADVNIDGSVTTADVGKINSHAKGVALLW